MSFSTEFEQTCHSLLETCGSQKIPHDSSRPSLAISKSHREGRSRTPAAKPLLDYVFGRDFCASSPRTHR